MFITLNTHSPNRALKLITLTPARHFYEHENKLRKPSANQKADAYYYIYALQGLAENNTRRNGINKGIHFLLKAEQFKDILLHRTLKNLWRDASVSFLAARDCGFLNNSIRNFNFADEVIGLIIGMKFS